MEVGWEGKKQGGIRQGWKEGRSGKLKGLKESVEREGEDKVDRRLISTVIIYMCNLYLPMVMVCVDYLSIESVLRS